MVEVLVAAVFTVIVLVMMMTMSMVMMNLREGILTMAEDLLKRMKKVVVVELMYCWSYNS